MIIEKYKDSTRFIHENSFIYPNQLVSSDEKEEKDFIKATCDYFSSMALMQYNQNKNTIPKNYDLYNGIFNFDDYINEDYTQEFLSILDNEPITDESDERLLKHYPIINGPIDTMCGENSARTNKERVKAMDELSQSEMFSHRQELITGYLQQQIQAAFAQQGLADSPEAQSSVQDIQQKAKTYATRAEQWGNKTLKALKNHFNIKAKSEEGFRDYLISGREFHHLYPDNSRIGFGYELVNPVNVWTIKNKNARTTDQCWAAGTCEILTISEILDQFKLTEKEIDFLYKQLKMPFFEDGAWKDSKRGINSIEFNAHPIGYFDTLQMQTAAMAGNNFPDLNDESAFSPGFNVNQNFVVIRGYYRSKEKIGLFTYTDEEGIEQAVIINDTVDKNILKQGKVEWTWRNKWMSFYRIGNGIYNLEPLKYANTLPLIGTFRRLKNSRTKSLLDLMKSYQALFNIVMNKLWHFLDTEIGGQVFVMDLRLIPKKDSQDPIETWLWEAKQKNVIFVDTSPENTGGAVQFNQMTAQDMSQTAVITRNIQLAVQLREMCWEMVGITRQRLGDTTSSETATSINTALNKSYAQTEPWFTEHEYVMQRVTQTLLDVAQYIELQKPESTLNYLNSNLDNVFLKVTRDELLRDLHVITTSASDDKRIVDMMKELAQPAMQNGAELEDIFDIMYSDSERKIKDILEEVRLRKQKAIEDQNSLEQQKMQMQQEQFQKEMERQENIRVEEMQNDNINKELDRQLDIQLATIKAIGEEGSYDQEGNTLLQVLEQSRLAHEISKDAFERNMRQKEVKQKDKELELKDKDIDTKLKIAKENKTKAEMTRKKKK
jgi:hypothetical protein